ncbi:MAG TPA: multicopper oxidase domain-containing protein [Nitrososphaera sp.]
MNKPVLAGIAAGILLAGIILGPGSFFGAQAQEQEQQNTGGNIKRVTMIADEAEVQIAPDNALHPGGVTYLAMVFNGTIPGPVVSVDQGDTVEFTLVNEGDVIHSMDFHAGDGANAAVGANASEFGSNIQPGESVTWTWVAEHAGVFFYHCGADGLNGVWEHIANGMYGGIVVHPQNEQPAAKEFYVVFGEIYSSNVDGVFTPANGTGNFDIAQFLSGNPDIVMTNGMAHKYVPAIGAHVQIELNPEAEVFQVPPGELTRWYIVNAGPNDGVAFHFISGILNVHDGSVMNRYGTQVLNDESWWIPPGSGSVIEITFPDEGIYVGVDHAMNDVVKGGAFAVLATPESTPDDYPAGTMVPPRGSTMVSGPPAMANATTGNATGGAAANATEGAAANATEAATQPAAQNQTLAVVPTNATEPPTGAPLANDTVASDIDTNETAGTAADAAAGGTNATEGAAGGAATGATGGQGGGSTTGVSIVQGSSSLTTDSYSPNPAQVSVGGTVTWTNNDSQPHTAMSGENATPDQVFDSGIMAPAATFSHTFTEAGEYPYFCLLHPNMVGTVSVS